MRSFKFYLTPSESAAEVETPTLHMPALNRGITGHSHMTTVSTITCPNCGYKAQETMPCDACQYFYECKGCRALLRPKPGDCCVFCSYADVPCPPQQELHASDCCASKSERTIEREDRDHK